MKRINLTIGVLFTESADLTPYLQRIYSFGFARLVTPGEKVGALDALIVPDNIGYYVGMRAFASNLLQTIACNKLCPYAETFRINGDRGFEYYKTKQTLLIGVGDGRIMLWDDLGYRCKVDGKQVYLVDPDDSSLIVTKRSTSSVVEEFRAGNYIGIQNVESAILTDALRQLAIIRNIEVQKDAEEFSSNSKKKTPIVGLDK